MAWSKGLDSIIWVYRSDSHTPSVLLSAELGRLYTENGIKGLDFRELIVNFDGHDIFTVKVNINSTLNFSPIYFLVIFKCKTVSSLL